MKKVVRFFRNTWFLWAFSAFCFLIAILAPDFAIFPLVIILISLMINEKRTKQAWRVKGYAEGRHDMVVAMTEAMSRGITFDEWMVSEAERTMAFIAENLPMSRRDRREFDAAMADLITEANNQGDHGEESNN